MPGKRNRAAAKRLAALRPRAPDLFSSNRDPQEMAESLRPFFEELTWAGTGGADQLAFNFNSPRISTSSKKDKHTHTAPVSRTKLQEPKPEKSTPDFPLGDSFLPRCNNGESSICKDVLETNLRGRKRETCTPDFPHGDSFLSRRDIEEISASEDLPPIFAGMNLNWRPIIRPHLASPDRIRVKSNNVQRSTPKRKTSFKKYLHVPTATSPQGKGKGRRNSTGTSVPGTRGKTVHSQTVDGYNYHPEVSDEVLFKTMLEAATSGPVKWIGQYNLGRAYYYGTAPIGHVDISLAIHWLELASEYNYEEAVVLLNEIRNRR